MTINFRVKPKEIRRNRSRGKYCLSINIRSDNITKDKAHELIACINSNINELRLVGIVKLKEDLTKKVKII